MVNEQSVCDKTEKSLKRKEKIPTCFFVDTTGGGHEEYGQGEGYDYSSGSH
jgi:hypothetical protein